MMPLAMVKPGEECTIKRIGGKEETRRFFRKPWICSRRYCNGRIGSRR